MLRSSFLLAFLAQTIAFAEVPATLQIGQFIGKGRERKMVYLAAGADQGIISGNIYEARRPRRTRDVPREFGEQWVSTGRIKITEAHDNWSIATILERSTPASAALFPKYPDLMAGDELVLQPIEIAQRISLTPNWSLQYDELFDDPRPDSMSLELSAEGRALLIKVAADFADLRLPAIGIDGHSDHEGDAITNQAESLQRALVVRQFLIDEAGLDSRRLFAFGMGESNLIVKDFKPQHAQRNRRIEIHVLGYRPEPTIGRLAPRDAMDTGHQAAAW